MLVKPSQTIYHRYKSPFGNTDVFPQAKIYEATSGSVFSTTNLSANANDSSLYEITDTAPSAEGLYHIVIIPYTTSGHATQYEGEQATIENLEVRADRHISAVGFGGDGGIMESDIKMIIEGVVKKLKDPILKAIDKIQLKEQKQEIDFSAILSAIEAIPEAEKYDDSKLNEILVRIENKIVPVNINPLKQAIDRIDITSVKKDLQEIKSREFPIYDDTKIVQAISALGEKIKEPDMSYVENCMNRMEILIAQINQNLLGMPGQNDQMKVELAAEMLRLGNLFEQYKEMMFKMDEFQQSRMKKIVETIQQAGFLNSVNIKEAMRQIQSYEELEV